MTKKNIQKLLKSEAPEPAASRLWRPWPHRSRWRTRRSCRPLKWWRAAGTHRRQHRCLAKACHGAMGTWPTYGHPMAILWDPRFHLKWSDFLVGFFGNPTLERGTPILKNLMVTLRMSPGLQNPRLPGTIWDVGRELGPANGVFN